MIFDDMVYKGAEDGVMEKKKAQLPPEVAQMSEYIFNKAKVLHTINEGWVYTPSLLHAEEPIVPQLQFRKLANEGQLEAKIRVEELPAKVLEAARKAGLYNLRARQGYDGRF
jgi:hypothetical protein